MNIILSTDNNYVQHCCATIASILRNNNDVTIYVLTEGLSNKNEELIKGLVYSMGGTVFFLIVQSSLLAGFPMPKSITHISIATYYRLFVSSLLPHDVDKALYLDCDIIVRKSLLELWNTDISQYALAAVYQDDPLLLNTNELERLNIDSKYGYFNAGVILINLSYWRENQIEEKLYSYIINNYERIVFHDQDTLNAVLKEQTKCLDCTWNMHATFFTKMIYKFSSPHCLVYKQQILDGYGKDPAVVHFVGCYKPWNWECVHPYKNEYFKYLDLTPFNGWRPKPVYSFNSIKDRLRDTFPFRYLPFYSPDSHIIHFK